VAEIAAASNEQSAGIEQINTAVGQMDQVTQSNAANAEESASASEELSAQAEELNNMVRELQAVVGGSGATNGQATTVAVGRTQGFQIDHESTGRVQELLHRGRKSGKAQVSQGRSRQGQAAATTTAQADAPAPETVIPMDDDGLEKF